MPTTSRDLNAASLLIEQAQRIIDGAIKELARTGGIDKNETLAYDIAHASSAIATARACLSYAAHGDTEADLTLAFLALAFSDLAQRMLGREDHWGRPRRGTSHFQRSSRRTAIRSSSPRSPSRPGSTP